MYLGSVKTVSLYFYLISKLIICINNEMNTRATLKHYNIYYVIYFISIQMYYN